MAIRVAQWLKDALARQQAEQHKNTESDITKQVAETERIAAEERAKKQLEAQARLQEQLEAQARGEGPSLSRELLKANAERSLANQIAMAKASRGGSRAALQRNLLRAGDTSRRELASQSTQAGLQEQLAAQQQLQALVTGDLAAADALKQNYLNTQYQVGEADRQARMDLLRYNAERADARSAKRQQGIGNVLGAIGGIASIFSDKKTKTAAYSDKKSKMPFVAKKKKKKDIGKGIGEAFKSLGGNSQIADSIASIGGAIKNLSDKKTKKGADTSKFKKRAKNFGKGISNPDPIIRFFSEKFKDKDDDKKEYSDVETKENLKYSDKKIKKFLDAVKPVAYNYKPEFQRSENDKEEQLGIIAQDLEKAGARHMVQEDANGIKTVDFGKGFGTILAAQAHLNKRLEEIEKKRKKG